MELPKQRAAFLPDNAAPREKDRKDIGTFIGYWDELGTQVLKERGRRSEAGGGSSEPG